MRKVFISVFITVLTFFFFSGCYDAIFQEIRTEVELNEGSISGFINKNNAVVNKRMQTRDKLNAKRNRVQERRRQAWR